MLAFRQTFTYEESQPEPHGRVWLSTKGVLKDESGAVFGLFGVSRDITERKRMEQALRRKEERVHLALSAAALTLWDLQLPEGLLRWERSASRHFGLPELLAEEPLTTFLARLHPEDRLSVAERLARCAESPGEVELDYRVLVPGGGERWHSLRARSWAEDGRIRRIIGILADTTGRAAHTAITEAA